ncbi:hypothetical protein NDU88_003874 [Pleurodeles waltl]|uniref:Uncharacterized protein n=1 Tax=Pleurodeles waltl TaxID=8319 RepID=A0AAV7UFI6_PLEWA|nr:hypothetical protein NDU88_003874 [Pleurodeles waltl]
MLEERQASVQLPGACGGAPSRGREKRRRTVTRRDSGCGATAGTQVGVTVGACGPIQPLGPCGTQRR